MTSNHTLADVLIGNISWTGVNTSSTNGSSSRPPLLNSTDVKPFETALLAVIIVVVVLVIFLLFALALYIDCRQQKIEAATTGKKTRISPKKSRIPKFLSNSSANSDALAFVNEMCKENSDTVTPYDAHSGPSSANSANSEPSSAKSAPYDANSGPSSANSAVQGVISVPSTGEHC